MSSRAGPGQAGPQTCADLKPALAATVCSARKSNYNTGPPPANTSTVTTCNSHLHKCKWDYSGFPNWSPGTLCKLNCGKIVVFPKSHELWKRKGELLKRFGKMFLTLRLHIHSSPKRHFSTYLRVEEIAYGRHTSVPNQKLQRGREEVVKLTKKAQCRLCGIITL